MVAGSEGGGDTSRLYTPPDQLGRPLDDPLVRDDARLARQTLEPTYPIPVRLFSLMTPTLVPISSGEARGAFPYVWRHQTFILAARTSSCGSARISALESSRNYPTSWRTVVKRPH